MNQQQQIIEWLQQDEVRMQALRCARRLGLKQWCLAAGFVRNLVWDQLHGHAVRTPLNDVDLVHFDASCCDAQRDKMLEARLAQWQPLPWSVKNQCRMHVHRQAAPYLSTEDAISYWTEVETAIGARLTADDHIELVAPLGVEALFTHTITFNPRHGDLQIFKQRVNDKQWLSLWPALRVVES